MNRAAIILAAGSGTRLRPYTDSTPKCMITSSDGIPLLHRAIEKLAAVGVTDIVLGVGFKKDSVMIPPVRSVTLHWVNNEEWDTTNNIHTLNLCIEYVKTKQLTFEDIFLVEGDVYLGDTVLDRLLMENVSGAAVLPASYTKRGSCVSVDDQNYVRILKDNREWNDPTIFKLANVYKLTRADFFELGLELPGRNRSQYYEAIMGELIGRVRLKAVVDGGCREIDNSYDRFCLSDLLNLDYETVRSNWGGLWRRSVQDHFFIANPFYPSPFISDRLKYTFEALMTNYPSGRRRLNAMLRAFSSVNSEFPLFAVNGASEAIRVLENHFREKGTSFALHFSPPFGEYLRFSLTDIEKADGLIVVSPNNPTGERVEIHELTRLLGKYECVILDLSLNTEKDRPYLELIVNHPNLIVVKSLSKLFGIPGLRLGYIALSEHVIENFESKLPIWNINSIAEGFMELHLDSLSDYEKSIEQWHRESLRMQGELEKIFALECLSSTTAFITISSVVELAKPLYVDYGLFVADVTSKFTDGRFHTRIGVKSRDQNEYLIYALKSLAQKPRSR